MYVTTLVEEFFCIFLSFQRLV